MERTKLVVFEAQDTSLLLEVKWIQQDFIRSSGPQSWAEINALVGTPLRIEEITYSGMDGAVRREPSKKHARVDQPDSRL
jgi:hypothetical protein